MQKPAGRSTPARRLVTDQDQVAAAVEVILEDEHTILGDPFAPFAGGEAQATFGAQLNVVPHGRRTSWPAPTGRSWAGSVVESKSSWTI
jgi:hypothetical protein